MTLSRRRFLARTSLGTAALLSGACAGPVRTDPNPSYLALPKGPTGSVHLARHATKDWRAACEQALDAVTDTSSWLSRGDTVFVKVACNSPSEHPAVTSPDAVRAIVAVLEDRGAGAVLVGDQAGVEHVRLTSEGRVSSTRETMAENGLLAAIEESGAEFHAFDDQGWNSSFAAQADFAGDHWEGGATLFLPEVLNRVQHVINLPRLGTHSLAGYTCAVKNGVGWLRDDSRKVLHQKAATFFEKMAEIHHFQPLRDKLRVHLTLGDAALLNIGPDFGSNYDFDGILALASSEAVDHDLVASAVLNWLDGDDTSFFDLYTPYPEDVDHWNLGLVEDTWGDEAIADYEPLVAFERGRGLEYDRALSHLAMLQNRRPDRVAVKVGGDPLPDGLLAYLNGYGDGLVQV
ncbi:MAG: hypothetical protein CO108_11705 [Deltaproteobacteria bacterium CG_4_9_14_3_um_filter_63_12]|nr:MAG: hypothetical protein CO108_11705 [Deltaproteobacteria bacterium CG_4_9_14_3_um_filter_63_12]